MEVHSATQNEITIRRRDHLDTTCAVCEVGTYKSHWLGDGNEVRCDRCELWIPRYLTKAEYFETCLLAVTAEAEGEENIENTVS